MVDYHPVTGCLAEYFGRKMTKCLDEVKVVAKFMQLNLLTSQHRLVLLWEKDDQMFRGCKSCNKVYAVEPVDGSSSASLTLLSDSKKPVHCLKWVKKKKIKALSL